MKTWNVMWKIAIVVGMITAISLADGTDASGKELWAAFVIVTLVMLDVFNSQLRNERKGEVR